MSADHHRVFAPRRYLSRLTRGTLAVIMAGGRGERLKHLTEDRCKPAAPFGRLSAGYSGDNAALPRACPSAARRARLMPDR